MSESKNKQQDQQKYQLPTIYSNNNGNNNGDNNHNRNDGDHNYHKKLQILNNIDNNTTIDKQQQQPIPLLNKLQQQQQNNSTNNNRNVIHRILSTIFHDFHMDSITFYLVAFNLCMWIITLVAYYDVIYHNNNTKITAQTIWNCLLLKLNGTSQSEILVEYQIWRLLLCGFVFNGWLQMYFNNFAVSMLGYLMEKRDGKGKVWGIFISGMCMGNLLSTCYGGNFSQISTGLSCGTISLLPMQFCRYFQLRISNPPIAKKRLRFLLILTTCNFILNLLSFFSVTKVDWLSHLGSLISGVLFIIIYGNIFQLFCPTRIISTKIKNITCICGIVTICGIYGWLLYYGWIVVRNNSVVIDRLYYNDYICDNII